MDFAANRVSSLKKGSIQRSRNEEFKEAKDIISKNGSRTALQSQDIIALQSTDDVTRRAES